MLRVLFVLLVTVCVNAHAATFNWKHRNVNPYMGSISAAIEDYRDVYGPAERKELARRIDAREYDDIVEIRRDTISGKYHYESTIWRMHSGSPGTKDPLRTSWTAADLERGLVYCSGSRCVLVPTVCRNVSLINRVEQLIPVQHAPAATVGGPAPVYVEVPPLEGGGATTTGGVPTVHALSVLPTNGDSPSESGSGNPPFIQPYYPPIGGGGGIVVITVPPVTTPVPEPAPWVLILCGALVLSLYTRRRNA